MIKPTWPVAIYRMKHIFRQSTNTHYILKNAEHSVSYMQVASSILICLKMSRQREHWLQKYTSIIYNCRSFHNHFPEFNILKWRNNDEDQNKTNANYSYQKLYHLKKAQFMSVICFSNRVAKVESFLRRAQSPISGESWPQIVENRYELRILNRSRIFTNTITKRLFSIRWCEIGQKGVKCGDGGSVYSCSFPIWRVFKNRLRALLNR